MANVHLIGEEAQRVTPSNLYRYKLGKTIMTGICIGIS